MGISLPRLLYEESFGVFLLVTVCLAGGASWLTGRAVAGTWRPWWHVLVYALILGAAARFFHHALFGGTFLSPRYYLVDAIVCLTLGFLAFRVTRAHQMSTQYAWLYTRNGLFGWRLATGEMPAEGRKSG